MELENIEYSIEAGEVVAPVSSLYKKWIREVLTEAVNSGDKVLYDYQAYFVRQTVLKSELFKKTNNQFREEITHLLSWSFETMYEAVKGVPFAPEVGTNTKTQLKLVK